MKLAFGSDHAGFTLRQDLAKWAESDGHEVSQFGATGTDSYDYPDAADLVAKEVLKGNVAFGVLVCGSGIGVDIRANRHEHIRAANCVTAQMAELCREHNHANVLCLGARLVDTDKAKQILHAFLTTEESREQRHVLRVEKIDRVAPNG